MQIRAGCVAQQYQLSGLYVNFSGLFVNLWLQNVWSSSITSSGEKKIGGRGSAFLSMYSLHQGKINIS